MKRIIAAAFLLTVICVFSVCIAIPLYIPVSLTDTAFTSGPDMVIIDAGHGGMDGGASSKDGSIVEKMINLNIALHLKSYLTACGYDVVMTRETDNAIHDSGSTIAQKKKSDMNNRLKIINQYPDAALISIHLNSFPQDRSVTGAQVFYSKNNEAFGQLAQNTLIKVLKPSKERICKQIPNSIYLMRNAKNPAILVECGFLSNEKEADLLNTAEYQKKIAFSLCLCMIEYNNGQLITEET